MNHTDNQRENNNNHLVLLLGLTTTTSFSALVAAAAAAAEQKAVFSSFGSFFLLSFVFSPRVKKRERYPARIIYIVGRQPEGKYEAPPGNLFVLTRSSTSSTYKTTECLPQTLDFISETTTTTTALESTYALHARKKSVHFHTGARARSLIARLRQRAFIGDYGRLIDIV